jgi:hypothetical protein
VPMPSAVVLCDNLSCPAEFVNTLVKKFFRRETWKQLP